MKALPLLILASLIILPACAFGQAPDTLWTRTYGIPGRLAECWDAVSTPNGGLITAGTITDPGYLSRIYLVRINSDGDTLWTAKYSERTAGRAICVTPDNGYVVTGYYVSSEVYPVIMKIDSMGNEIWSRIYEYWGGAALRSCQPVGNDGYILSGFTYTNDALLVRINPSGDTLWSRTYGGFEAEKFWSARPTSDGGFIIVGWTESFGNGGSDFYVIKTDQNGDSVWVRTYGDSRNEEAREIMETPNSGYVFSGKRAVTELTYEFYFMKIDFQGDSLWAFADSAYAAPGILHSFTPAASGGFAAIGYTWYSIDVYRISNAGGLYWSRIFMREPIIDGYGRSIIQSEDHGFFLCGNNSSDIWVAKLAPDIVGIHDEIISLPENITLHQNYPNPFNANTTISFTLKEPRYIILSVYDLLGRKVEVLLDGFTEAGTHKVNFEAGNYPSGLYFYRLETGDYDDTRMMLLLK